MDEEDFELDDDYDDYDYDEDGYDEEFSMGKDNPNNNPPLIETEDEALAKFREVTPTLSGTNFTLLMKVDDGFKVYPRPNQPCMGEMRKYKRSHPETYTDPYTGKKSAPSDDYRPGDLYCPFPEGEPLAVGLWHQGWVDVPDPILEFAFSGESPWRRGLPDQDKIELIRKNDKIVGVYVFSTDFDPTVFVNLVNAVRSIGFPTQKGYESVVEFYSGLTPLEFLLFRVEFTPFFTMDYGQPVDYRNGKIVFKDVHPHGYGPGYYSPMQTDFRRFIRGEARDLNGNADDFEIEKERTFRLGYDYNRKIFHEVFQDTARRKGGSELQDRFKGLLSSGMSSEDQLDLALRVVREAIDEVKNQPQVKVEEAA